MIQRYDWKYSEHGACIGPKDNGTYVRYADIWDAVAILREVMASGVWDQPKYHKRAAVT